VQSRIDEASVIKILPGMRSPACGAALARLTIAGAAPAQGRCYRRGIKQFELAR